MVPVMEKIVVGVTGMPGAGKATARKLVQKLGYPVVVMGDVIRDEVARRNLEPTPENIGFVMLKLREEEGSYVVAERCIPKIRAAKNKVVFIDGIRSLDEVEEFKRHFANFMIIAIHSTPETRFRRLFKRRRSDDPKNRKTFAERDSRELIVGLGGVIATADHMIINEGSRIELESRVRGILKEVIGK
jgi:dephospho-CoA kinase